MLAGGILGDSLGNQIILYRVACAAVAQMLGVPGDNKRGDVVLRAVAQVRNVQTAGGAYFLNWRPVKRDLPIWVAGEFEIGEQDIARDGDLSNHFFCHVSLHDFYDPVGQA